MYTEEERAKKARNAAARIVENLNQMTEQEKLAYVEKLVAMFDDTRLMMLDFAVEMTPNQGKKEDK